MAIAALSYDRWRGRGRSEVLTVVPKRLAATDDRQAGAGVEDIDVPRAQRDDG
jgi:hypothetical protein